MNYDADEKHAICLTDTYLLWEKKVLYYMDLIIV